jgi:hypothetical protein
MSASSSFVCSTISNSALGIPKSGQTLNAISGSQFRVGNGRLDGGASWLSLRRSFSNVLQRRLRSFAVLVALHCGNIASGRFARMNTSERVPSNAASRPSTIRKGV